MPFKNGYDTAKDINSFFNRKSEFKCPIIAYTGNTDPLTLNMCQSAGMNGYIQKPID